MVGNVHAQQDNSAQDQQIVTIRSAAEDGTVTIKKKRLENGQSVQDYVNDLNIKDAQDVEITITSKGANVGSEKENIFFFRGDNGHSIKINGEGDWQEALINMDFDFDDFHSGQHQRHEINFKKENDVLLGVYPANDSEGVRITGTVSGSGAAKAGMQKNDIMIAINGERIQTSDDLHDELAKYKANDVVVVDILRNGQPMVISSTLTARENSYSYRTKRDPCKVFFGIYVGNYGNGRQGVGVSGIIKGNDWPAEKAGLREGDRIVAIDGIPVGTHNELVTERNKHNPGDNFTFTVLRNGEAYDFDAQFKSCPKDEEPISEPAIEDVIPTPEEPIEYTDNQLELEEFNAYPNPTFGNLNIRFSGEAVPTLVRIVDSAGKVVYEENVRNFDGYYNKEVDISGGALGTMVLSISQEGKAVAKSVVLVTRA